MQAIVYKQKGSHRFCVLCNIILVGSTRMSSEMDKKKLPLLEDEVLKDHSGVEDLCPLDILFMVTRATKMKHDIDKLKHPMNNIVMQKEEPKAMPKKFMNDTNLAQRKRPYLVCKVLTFMRSERSHDKQFYSKNLNPRLLTTFEEKHLQLH